MTTELMEKDDSVSLTEDENLNKREKKEKLKDILRESFEGKDGKEWKSIYCYCRGRIWDDVTLECIGSWFGWCDHGGIFHWKCV